MTAMYHYPFTIHWDTLHTMGRDGYKLKIEKESDLLEVTALVLCTQSYPVVKDGS